MTSEVHEISSGEPLGPEGVPVAIQGLESGPAPLRDDAGRAFGQLWLTAWPLLPYKLTDPWGPDQESARCRLGFITLASGMLGRVLAYVRPNGRSPGAEFLDQEAEPRRKKAFLGEFQSIVVHKGASYQNHVRFKPLRDPGKPLWEFKESDHRLYCLRTVEGKCVEIVLLNGWIKDKEGRSKQEDNEIERAVNLLREYQDTRGGKQ